MKKFKIISIVLGVILLFIAVAGIIFSTIYEDEVKGYILTQINNSTTNKIDVEEVNFSIFKKFPYASLEFKNINAEEATASNEKGTLFSAQSVYLQFNVFDILNKNYTIKKINVKDGIVNIQIDKNGLDNYHFWKPSKDSTSTQLSIELEKLLFEEVTFYVLNDYKNLDMSLEAVKLGLSGNFSQDNFTLTTQSELFVHQINEDGKSLLNDTKININTSLEVNQNTQLYNIKKGEITLQDLSFDLSGNIQNKEEGVVLDIQSKGQDLEIASLFSLFPTTQQNVLKSYKTKGIITYNSFISGVISTTKSPKFEADFNINNGEVVERSSDNSLSNITIKGRFTNGAKNDLKSSKLVLEELDADFGAGHISGKYVISNFSNPYIELDAKADIEIATAKDFFKLDTLESANGNISLNLTYNGYIKELNDIKAKDLQKLNAKGTVEITNANFKVIDNSKTFNNINGAFKFNNNDVKIDSLSIQLNQSQINLKGHFKNLLAYLFIEGQNLAVNTTVYAPKLVVDDLLISSNDKNADYKLSLPNDIRFSFKTKIDTFLFRKFSATNFSGNISLNNKTLVASNLKFNSMNGSVSGKIMLDNTKENTILITSNAQLNEVDIHQMFIQFENFGQKYIVAENLKGTTTSDIQFASVWDEALNIDQNKIYALANIIIKKGELNNYKPIQAMSKFIEVEELKNIKFSTLSTQIEIKDKTIIFPQTEMKSSALDITFSGTHSFDSKIDYRFKLLMNDILWGKAKTKKKENSEFGYIADDGLGRTTLFLKMVGTTDDYKISYDTKGLKNKWKKDLKKEKTTIKNILNKEFGWFKKDSTVNKNPQPKEDDGFEMEWDENEKEKTQPKQDQKEKSTTKKKKKGLGKLIDKIAKPEEEYEEFDDF